MSIETKGARAVRMRDAGLSNAEIAAVLGMSKDRARGLISETRAVSGRTRTATLLSAEATAEHELNAVRVLEREMPGFYQEFKTNKENTGKKPVHIMVPDTQCKPGVSLEHLRWAGEYIAEREPDVVVAIGDWWDMESLSEYDRGKKSFEGRRYKADIEAGNEGMDLFMAGVNKCKKRPRLVFTMGNHEERILRALEIEPRLEGVLGYHDFNLERHGWEVYDFLTPVSIDGIHYAHYFSQPMSGRPYSGNIETRLRAIGFSFSQGHQQGLWWGRRELANGAVQLGLVAGSYYLHDEVYKGVQGNKHWRGLVVKHEVDPVTGYDPMFTSIRFLQEKYG